MAVNQTLPSLASGLRPRPRRFTIRIYGSKPNVAILGLGASPSSDVVDNKCYIPTGNSSGMKNTCYLSYLTFDTTSYQSQELNDKLVRTTQPVLSL